MSDFIINSFQTPNAIVDKLMELLTDSELRVLMYTVRHVLGWQNKIAKRKATISISNFVGGFSYTDNKGAMHTYAGCGLKDAAVRDALQSLEKYRVLKSSGPTAQGREWELAFMTDDNVDFEGLVERHYEKNQKGRAKIAHARELNPKLTPSVQQNPSCDTEPTPFCTTEPTPSCDTGDNETHGETQEEKHIAPKVAKPYYDAIASILDIHGGQNADIQKMLEGKATKKPYAENNLSPAMSLEEFTAWGAWAKRQLGQYIPKSPAKLNGCIIGYRAKQSRPSASLQAAADTIFSANTLATDGVVTFEKRAK